MTTQTSIVENKSFTRPPMDYPRPPDCGDMSFYFVANFRANRTFECDELLFMSVGAIISFAVMAGNVLVIFVFLKTKDLRKSVPGRYKLSLACSDLMHGCLVPYILFNVAHTEEQILQFTTVWSCYFGLWILSTSVSICTLCALAIDRLRVIWPQTIKASDNSTKVTSIIITGIWLVSITLAVTPTVLFNLGELGYVISASGTVFLATDLKEAYVAFFSVGLGSTVITNVALVYAIRSRLNDARNLSANPNNDGRKRVQRKAATIVFAMSITFVLSVLPMAIYSSFPALGSDYILCLLPIGVQSHAGVLKYPSHSRRLEASIWLIFATNGMWNCIIYSFRDAVFRDAVKSMLRPTVSNRRGSHSTQNIFHLQSVA